VNAIKGTIQVTMFGKSCYILSLTSTMNEGDGTNGWCSRQTRSYTSHTVVKLQLTHSFHHKQQWYRIGSNAEVYPQLFQSTWLKVINYGCHKIMAHYGVNLSVQFTYQTHWRRRLCEILL